ncbi:MAG: aliphatic sulfonate ABC transporter substrate-binding protein [Lachnospiraceae bacterium]|nr:aliphatic sulfonate ABC transporter substrate-binding protein [Lachnospiraceae bacterium]
MKKTRILSCLTALALGITMLSGCGSSSETKDSDNAGANNSSSVVNIAIQPSAAFIPLYIARENGWIEEALKEQGVEVNWNEFESGPPMNESLASGSSDIGVMGDVPAVSSIAAGQKNEIIATAADGAKSYAMLVSADSDIASVTDLKGKKVGATVGSTAHNLIDKILAKNNLDINSDIELVNISTGDAATVLSTGAVDAVAIWEPNVTRLVADGTAKIIGEGPDCGLLGVNPIIARAEYAQNNPEVIRVIIEQYARGVAALDNLDENVKKKVADALSLDPELLADVAAKYEYTVKISDADVENLQDTISFLVKIGNLDKEYEIKDYVKRDYVENADIAQYINVK